MVKLKAKPEVPAKKVVNPLPEAIVKKEIPQTAPKGRIEEEAKISTRDVKEKGLPQKNKGKVSKKGPLWLKEIILGVINLVFIVGLIFILGKLPGRAEELKSVRNTEFKNTVKSEIEIAGLGIESTRVKSEELMARFPNEKGLITFAREIDKLKSEGYITKFAFASEEAVRDRTGYWGIPFVIEFRGPWKKISEGLVKVQGLPFLIRPVSIESSDETPEGEKMNTFSFGGFLYVDENFAKTKNR